MRQPARFAVLMLLIGGATLAAQPPAQRLPPVSYICDMPGDEAVLEDRPGTCPNPACKMALRPVRLDAKYWCPTHQTIEVHDAPGTCRRDGKALVPVTLALSWTCGNQPDVRLSEPGTCADGSVRRVRYEARAHGDHNPRHGGQFFMAADAWHHVEGTHPESGLFRVFLYDNFTKPMNASSFSGSVVIRDAADKEVTSAPLRPASDSTTLEARVPDGLPLRVTLKLRLAPGATEQNFDFQFAAYTK